MHNGRGTGRQHPACDDCSHDQQVDTGELGLGILGERLGAGCGQRRYLVTVAGYCLARNPALRKPRSEITTAVRSQSTHPTTLTRSMMWFIDTPKNHGSTDAR